MKIPDSRQFNIKIRPIKKKTRFWVDNEVLEIYGLRLKASGLAIYCALARHANSDTQACFPSYERIMALTGIGKRSTVSKYLKILENLGLVFIYRNKKRLPNIYYLLEINTNTKSIQMDTSVSDETDLNSQKEDKQYPNSALDDGERDTVTHITKSNKEVGKASISDYKPDFLR